jgi:hypothetical protein
MNFAICVAPDNPTDKIFNIFDVYKKNNIEIIFLAKSNTDHQSYKKISSFYDNFKYLSVDEQYNINPNLFDSFEAEDMSKINIGILSAYFQGCDAAFLIDLNAETEFNYLFEKLTVQNFLNKEFKFDFYTADDVVFDPYQPTTTVHLWHRGYPWEKLISRNNFIRIEQKPIKPLVQACLINGSTDCDNLGNLFFQPQANFVIDKPFSSDLLMPFNCKNTLIHRDAIPYYFIFSDLGNMGDILGSYIFQLYRKNSVLYCWPTVTRYGKMQSTLSDLDQDLKDQKLLSEFFFCPQKYKSILPKKNLISLEIYRKNFPEINFESGETSLLSD